MDGCTSEKGEEEVENEEVKNKKRTGCGDTHRFYLALAVALALSLTAASALPLSGSEVPT